MRSGKDKSRRTTYVGIILRKCNWIPLYIVDYNWDTWIFIEYFSIKTSFLSDCAGILISLCKSTYLLGKVPV